MSSTAGSRAQLRSYYRRNEGRDQGETGGERDQPGIVEPISLPAFRGRDREMENGAGRATTGLERRMAARKDPRRYRRSPATRRRGRGRHAARAAGRGG